MRLYLRSPLLCVLALILSFNTFAKTAKSINPPITCVIENTLNQGFDANQSITISTSTSNFAAATSLLNEASIPVASALNISLFNQGFFYGFLMMVILINSLCYFLFNDKVFGYFSFALIAFAMLFFNADSLLSLLVVDISSNYTPITTTLICFTMGMMALFSASFLSTEDSFPKLKAYTKPLFAIAATTALCTWYSDISFFVIVSNVLSFVLIGIYFCVGVALFNKKNYAKLYVITSSIPLLFAVDYFLLHGLGIEFLNTQTIHIKTAFFIEMLIMTYAIVYRMNVIKEEIVIRKSEMQLFLKRQETLSRDSLAKMMEDVYLENLIMQYDLDGLEIKLLQYISEGKKNAKIAKKLNTTEEDIELITKDLYQKLEISEAIEEDYRLLESQPDYLYN
ncbi:7TM diverse intracellular signaling domain-containing protein [Patiriisocius marinus]|uniref:7TM-DISM receptor extracellular domain-containing protein n=1 Tax=Patiriisocius marinus TaxID=1397112 RepID=A0A5J4IZZ3_9FLAO|nr:7TM diverse intracellular signaling domain-containing protein [Patiriisocius marinus]GER59218.1 hypothetical protein ULMA_13260 [Patiriisocius marinus]